MQKMGAAVGPHFTSVKQCYEGIQRDLHQALAGNPSAYKFIGPIFYALLFSCGILGR